MTKPAEEFEFVQWLHTKKLYHLDLEHALDGSDLPLTMKPVWQVVHQNPDGSPSPGLGMLETSPDAMTGRFTAEQPGTVTLTIVAAMSVANAVTVFRIRVLPHPPTPVEHATFKVRQLRNGPTH
jgi:hypothetical protein